MRSPRPARRCRSCPSSPLCLANGSCTERFSVTMGFFSAYFCSVFLIHPNLAGAVAAVAEWVVTGSFEVEGLAFEVDRSGWFGRYSDFSSDCLRACPWSLEFLLRFIVNPGIQVKFQDIRIYDFEVRVHSQFWPE